MLKYIYNLLVQASTSYTENIAIVVTVGTIINNLLSDSAYLTHSHTKNNLRELKLIGQSSNEDNTVLVALKSSTQIIVVLKHSTKMIISTKMWYCTTRNHNLAAFDTDTI